MTGQQNKSKALDAELENRLDELFGDDDAPTLAENAAAPPDSPLADLKSSVLSIDWEITDEGLQHFASKIKSARESFGENKIVLMFLQILGSLGEYIKSNRGKAHPKTFKILTAVFSGLEKVVTQPEMSEIEKKKTLQVELKRYNELRGIIQKKKPKTEKKTTAVSEAADEPVQAAPTASEIEPTAQTGDAETITLQMLTAAITDLKEYVHAEIEALRKEIMR